ncbi:MAG: transglycosylase family protein, partial [Acidimicrobiales bacterium]
SPPPVASEPVASEPAPTSPAGGVWAELRQCESSGNYGENSGNGYYGAYQFSLATWEAIGYSGLPSNAAPSVQDQAAMQLQAQRGWGQWPQCSRELGLT